MSIVITHGPNKEKLNSLGVFSWPIWEHETAEFPWTYDSEETCYLLRGL